jgi:protein-tyrosine phosphatase
MNSILMVCLGNICRSPLAEGIMQDKLTKAGLYQIRVHSAGTADFHVGETPDPRSINNALKHGIDIRSHRGRQFKTEDFSNYDIIYVMDESNYTNVIALTSNADNQAKVKLILDVIEGNNRVSVPDPYFGGEEGFEAVFQMLDRACEIVLKKIQQPKS